MAEEVPNLYRAELGAALHHERFRRDATARVLNGAQDALAAGQTLPTTTLTATARWTVTWTSSVNPDPQRLDVPPTATTAEVPVAEIQSVVTGVTPTRQQFGHGLGVR